MCNVHFPILEIPNETGASRSVKFGVKSGRHSHCQHLPRVISVFTPMQVTSEFTLIYDVKKTIIVEQLTQKACQTIHRI